MGILGAMLAQGALGGAAGAGQGSAAAGKEWTASLNEQAKQEAIGLREANLAAINNAAAMERTETTEAGANKRLDVSEAGATSRQQQGFTHAENLQGARLKFEGEQNEARNKLTSQEIASREKIASANNATALQVAKIGGSVTTDKDGAVLWINKEGQASAVKGPDGKPMQSYKDLTPAAKQYADVLKAQLVDLDKQETAAATTGDQSAIGKITERRAQLNGELLNVLTGGIGEAGKNIPKPAGKTGWDSSSGKVYKDGKEIGTAKSEGEARKIAAKPVASNSETSAPGGRPLYGKTTGELSRVAGRPKGTSSADAEEAQRELDARKGESRMSAG